MTPSLEDDLRAMLHDRAQDVTAVPESVFAFEQSTPSSSTVVDLGRPRHPAATAPRRHLLAIAAGVAAVLALAGTVLTIRQQASDTPAPPGTAAPSTSSAPTPTAARIVPRTAALDFVGFDKLPGYRFGSQETRPGYYSVGLTPSDDSLPAGSNGGLPSTAYITVWDVGRFDASTVSGLRTVDVAGRTGYVGKLSTPAAGRLTTLAYQARDGRWVLVQGRTSRTTTDQALVTMGRAVRTDRTVPLSVPFTLSRVPTGSRVTRVTDNISGDAFSTIDLTGTALDTQFHIYAARTPEEIGTIDLATAERIRVHTRLIYVDPQAGEALTEAAPGVTLAIGVTAHGSDTLTAAQQRQLTRLLTGITWPESVTAQVAIP